jgi:hypothetical protein
MQVQLTQARKASADSQPMGAPSPSVAGGVPAATPAALQALRAQLRAARDAEGRLSRGKALRLFVQAALLDELGESLQLDPAMSDLLERICRTLEEDSASAPLLAEALEELQAWAA